METTSLAVSPQMMPSCVSTDRLVLQVWQTVLTFIHLIRNSVCSVYSTFLITMK